MPLLPAAPGHRKILAGSLLGICAMAAAYQAFRFFHTEHEHAVSTILLYDLDRQVLAHFPPGTLPGDHKTAALALFAKTADHAKPTPGMTLDELEKAGLQPGWLYRLAEDRVTGLYADPRQPGQWARAGSPECRVKLNLWTAKAAAFSSTGAPILCRD